MSGVPINAGDPPWSGDRASGAARAHAGRVLARSQAWIGPLSLIICPLLLVAFIAVRYGISSAIGIRALAAVYVLGVIPGYLVQHHVFGLRARTLFETLLSSLLLGTLLTPMLWYVLCWIGLSALFFPLMFAVGLAVPVACRWHRQAADRLQRLVTVSEAPILWLALGLAVLWCSRFDLVTIRDGQAVIQPHDDHLFHVSLVAEMARGVPPATAPFIACVDKLAYHLMPDVWCDMVRRVAGVNAREAYFYLAQPFCYVLITFACYLALVGRFGRAAAIVGAGCVLAFAGYPDSRCLLTNWLLTFLHSSYPSMLGLVGVFLILYYVSRTTPDRYRAPLLLMSILSALLLWYKANFALVMVPAVAVCCLVVLVRRRDFRWLLLCVGVQGLLFAIRFVENASADYQPTLVLDPFGFIRYLWLHGTLWLKQLQGSHPLSFAAPALEAVRWRVEALPELLRWPVAYGLCMVYLFHLGMIIVPYAILRCGFCRRQSQARTVDYLMLLIFLVCLGGFAFFPIQPGWAYNICKHIVGLVYALLFALMGPALCDLVRRGWRRGNITKAATVGLLGVAFVGNAYALCHRTLWNRAYVRHSISEGTYACYRYIEQSTPQDAMILQPRFDRGPCSSGLTLRRSAQELALGFHWGPEIKQLLSGLKSFYAGTEPATARSVLTHYGVDYVVADRSLPGRAGYDPFLAEVFHAGEMAVYRVVE